MSNDEALLKAILSMTARQAIPPKALIQIIVPKGVGDNQLLAYNMCDGSKSQGEIAKSLKLDPSNFSKTVARWIDAGIIVRLGDGRDTKLQHIYALSKEEIEREHT